MTTLFAIFKNAYYINKLDRFRIYSHFQSVMTCLIVSRLKFPVHVTIIVERCLAGVIHVQNNLAYTLMSEITVK